MFLKIPVIDLLSIVIRLPLLGYCCYSQSIKPREQCEKLVFKLLHMNPKDPTMVK